MGGSLSSAGLVRSPYSRSILLNLSREKKLGSALGRSCSLFLVALTGRDCRFYRYCCSSVAVIDLLLSRLEETTVFLILALLFLDWRRAERLVHSSSSVYALYHCALAVAVDSLPAALELCSCFFLRWY